MGKQSDQGSGTPLVISDDGQPIVYTDGGGTPVTIQNPAEVSNGVDITPGSIQLPGGTQITSFEGTNLSVTGGTLDASGGGGASETLDSSIQGLVFIDPGGLGIGSAGDYSAINYDTGSTFTDAADAGTVINSLWSDMKANEVGPIHIGVGSFPIQTQVVGDADSFTLRGSHFKETILRSEVADYAIKIEGTGSGEVNHVNFAHLSDFQLFKTNTTDAGGILMRYTGENTLERLWIRDFNEGREAFRGEELWETRAWRLLMSGGETASSTYCIELATPSGGLQCNHNTFVACTFGSDSGDILHIDDSQAIKFDHCKTNISASGLTCATVSDTGGSSNSTRQIYFIGHEFTRDTSPDPGEGTGFQLNAGQDIKLIGCVFTGLDTAMAGSDANFGGTIVGCHYAGNTTVSTLDPNQLAGAAANDGYSQHDNGIATVSNGTTSVTVTPDLTDGVKNYTIFTATPRESLGTASHWYCTQGGSDFTIHVDADPGKDLDFSWTAQNADIA